jgi:hypothetical protein
VRKALQHFDRCLCQARARVRADRIERDARLAVTGQIDRDEAMLFDENMLHLPGKYSAAEGIAVQQEHRQASTAALLSSDGAM